MLRDRGNGACKSNEGLELFKNGAHPGQPPEPGGTRPPPRARGREGRRQPVKRDSFELDAALRGFSLRLAHQNRAAVTIAAVRCPTGRRTSSGREVRHRLNLHVPDMEVKLTFKANGDAKSEGASNLTAYGETRVGIPHVGRARGRLERRCTGKQIGESGRKHDRAAMVVARKRQARRSRDAERRNRPGPS